MPDNDEAQRVPLKPQSHAERTQVEPLLLLGLCTAALLLRFHNLDRQSIWYDEANGIRIAMRSLPDLFTELTADASPPLYYLVMHAWVALFGHQEFAVRAFSALAGAGAVPVVFMAGRRLFGRRTAWAAALLATLSPFHVYYSQEGRMYALLALASAVLLLQGFLAGRRDRRRDWCGFAVACAVAAYVHNYGIFVCAGVATALGLQLRRRPQALTHLGLACAAAALLYLPWLPHALRSQLQGSAITGGWLPRFSFSLIPQTITHLGSLQAFSANGLLFWIGHAALILALAAAFVLWLRTSDSRSRWRWRVRPATAYVAIALLVSAALPIAISAAKPIYLPERYAIAFWPAFVLLLAAGLCRLPRFWLLADWAALLLTSLGGLYLLFAMPQKSGDRLAAIFLAEQLRDTDLVVFAPHWTAVAPLYYLKALPHQAGYPMRTLEERSRHNEALERERRSLEDMTRDLNAHGRHPGARIILVRLLTEWETDAAQLQQAIERGWTRTAGAAFPPVAVLIYEPGPALRGGNP